MFKIAIALGATSVVNGLQLQTSTFYKSRIEELQRFLAQPSEKRTMCNKKLINWSDKLPAVRKELTRLGWNQNEDSIPLLIRSIIANWTTTTDQDVETAGDLIRQPENIVNAGKDDSSFVQVKSLLAAGIVIIGFVVVAFVPLFFQDPEGNKNPIANMTGKFKFNSNFAGKFKFNSKLKHEHNFQQQVHNATHNFQQQVDQALKRIAETHDTILTDLLPVGHVADFKKSVQKIKSVRVLEEAVRVLEEGLKSVEGASDEFVRRGWHVYKRNLPVNHSTMYNKIKNVYAENIKAIKDRIGAVTKPYWFQRFFGKQNTKAI